MRRVAPAPQFDALASNGLPRGAPDNAAKQLAEAGDEGEKMYEVTFYQPDHETGIICGGQTPVEHVDLSLAQAFALYKQHRRAGGFAAIYATDGGAPRLRRTVADETGIRTVAAQ